jgi:hypothetical protein
VDGTDWIEHVVATGGEPYMKPPLEDLGFIVRNSIDVAAFWMVLAGLPAYLIWRRQRRRRQQRASTDPGTRTKAD